MSEKLQEKTICAGFVHKTHAVRARGRFYLDMAVRNARCSYCGKGGAVHNALFSRGFALCDFEG